MISFIAISHIPDFAAAESREKLMAEATVQQIKIAIEAYHNEYGEYPEKLEELNGENERKKLFFDGIKQVKEKYEIYFVVDKDGDGFVKTDMGKLEQKIAVWIYFKKKLIGSWQELDF